MPTEAERGTAPVGMDGGGASAATTATLPEPVFCSRGPCLVGSGSLQLPVGDGSALGAHYGILAGSLRRPHPLYDLPFATAIWASGYVVLPEAGIYKPIWE